MALRPEDAHQFQAAEDAFATGRYRQALAGFRNYLKGRLETMEAGAYYAPDALAIERLAQLSSHLGGEAEAELLMEQLVAIYRRLGNGLCERLAILRLAHLILRRGDLRLCRQTLDRLKSWSGPLDEVEMTQEGLQRWESGLSWPPSGAGDRSVVLALWYLLLGRLFAANGLYGEAGTAFLQGLEHAGAEESRIYEVGLRIGRAQALLEAGELDSALGLAAAKSKVTGPESLAGLEIVAKIQLMQGYLGEAKRTYEQAVERSRELGLPLAAGALRLDLAHLLILINQTGRARSLIAEAGHLAGSVGAEQLGKRAVAMDELARLRRTSLAGETPLAPSVMELQMEAVGEIRHREPQGAAALDLPAQESFLGTMEDRLVQFQHALALHGPEGAMALLGLLESFGRSDSPLVAARLDVARGLFLYGSERFAESDRQFAAAEPIFAQRGLLLELRQLKRYKTWCAARMGDARRVEAHRREESVLLDKLAHSLEVGDQGLFWLNKWTSEEESLSADLAKLLSSRTRALERGWLQPFRRLRLWWATGRFLQRLEDHRELRLSQALDLGHYAHRRGSWWLKLLRYPRSLATVSFLVLPDRVFTGCVWGFGADFRVSAVSRIEIRSEVRDFHHQMVKDTEGNASAEPLGRLMHALGLESLLLSLPARIRHLAFVPDDALLGIPFAVMPIGNGLAVDRWAVSHSFHWFPERQRRRVDSALLVAAPDPGCGLKRLDHAAGEIRAVEEICKLGGIPVIRLEEDEALRQQVLHILGTTSLWHVSCHGIFRPEAPGTSGIVLHNMDTQKLDILSLRDLAQWDLHKIRLACLTACWSADSFVSTGRWVLSLPLTLHASGVQTVVGSLWEALDEVSAQFTQAFYEGLRQGVPCDEAFRNALLNSSKDPRGKSRPLWDWAGFILTGNVTPVKWRGK